jgi:hypothetical protein
MKNIELTSEERTLIARARDGADPTEIQRVRVRKSLDAKIAAGVAAPVMATSAGLATLLKVGAGVAIAAALGGGAIYFAASTPSLPAATPKAPHARAARLSVLTPEGDSQPVTAPSPAAASETPSPPSHPRGSPRRREANFPPVPPADLTGELGILTEASAATRQGDAARADELLRSYDERYPSGQLTQERAAAGVLAHCAAGRTQLARAEARRFLERWPRSPLVARIRVSCAGEDKAP